MLSLSKHDCAINFCHPSCLRVAPPAKVLYGGQALRRRQATSLG